MGIMEKKMETTIIYRGNKGICAEVPALRRVTEWNNVLARAKPFFEAHYNEAFKND